MHNKWSFQNGLGNYTSKFGLQHAVSSMLPSVAKFSEKENWGTKYVCGVCFLHCTTRAGLRGLPYICYYLENKCIVFEFIELLPLQIAPATKHAGIH
jgi:hypothetical protein